jgi:hypothetical protein
MVLVLFVCNIFTSKELKTRNSGFSVGDSVHSGKMNSAFFQLGILNSVYSGKVNSALSVGDYSFQNSEFCVFH